MFDPLELLSIKYLSDIIRVNLPQPTSLLEFTERIVCHWPEDWKKYESDDVVIGLIGRYYENQSNHIYLKLLSDRMEELGYPASHIKIEIMRHAPHLWDSSWWPTGAESFRSLPVFNQPDELEND